MASQKERPAKGEQPVIQRPSDHWVKLKSIVSPDKGVKVGAEPPPQGTGDKELDKAIEGAGYSYDPEQDIFYSTMDPWQRKVGYCRLYDEAAAPFGMIMDCEPIYFTYGGKKWMIAFWKGQYDMVTGGEIGVYKERIGLHLPGAYNDTLYGSVSDAECLPLSFILKKKGKILFTRKEVHWWLTGFKLGEFSEPKELTMDISLTLHNMEMRDAFVTGLKKAGYLSQEIFISGNTVEFTFDRPRTPQPISRTKPTDWIIQRKNELLCKKYREITGEYDTVRGKIRALKKLDPSMYKRIFKLGKFIPLYRSYRRIITGLIILAVFASLSNNNYGNHNPYNNCGPKRRYIYRSRCNCR